MANLTELNLLRGAAGMKPLKAWKESKDKLAAAIKKLMKPNVKIEDVTSGATPVTAAVAKPKVVKDASKKSTVEGVGISTIAAELGIDPKVARAKLRRQDEVPCIEGSKWMFAQKDVATIKAILKGDARKTK
jgi:hypothetical protein